MREICFIGKRLDNGEWIEGDLLRDYWLQGDQFMKCAIRYKIDSIYSFPVEVEPSSVGMFTNLHDKHGKRIFEGDVITGWTSANDVVAYDSNKARFTPIWIQLWNNEIRDKKIEIIGNIHDNPNLLQP